MNMDISKFKRIFAFGCSFTSWIYPTYADIIMKSASPDAQLYNFGKSGGSNLFILNRLTEANRKYQFNGDDLIIIMWTTFYRFNMYKKDKGWITPGNIYSQGQLTESFVKEIEDQYWFLMNDFSVIDAGTTYLQNCAGSKLMFLSVPLNYEILMSDRQEEVREWEICSNYRHLTKTYPISMWEFLNRKWPGHVKYTDKHQSHLNIMIDYHPSPKQYLNYLLNYNVPLSQSSIDYALDAERFLTETPDLSREMIDAKFPEIEIRQSDAYKKLW